MNSFFSGDFHRTPADPGNRTESWSGLAPSMFRPQADSSPAIDQSSSAFERLRARIGVNQFTTLRSSLVDDLRTYAECGVPAIGLNWRKLAETGIRKSLRCVQQSPLQVSSVGWIGGFTGKDGHSLPQIVEEGKRLIQAAGQLRARTVTVLTGPQAGHIRSHAVRIVVGALQELTHWAEVYGVELALQPMHPMFVENWSFLHTLEESLEILDRVKHSRLRLAFGTYHLWEEVNLLQRLQEVAPRVGLAMLSDWGPAPRHENDRLFPGSGNLPIAEMMQCLEEGGFSGWYELEVWSRDLWKLPSRDLMQRCADARNCLSSQICGC